MSEQAMILTNHRDLAYQHVVEQWRRIMKRFFMIEFPLALIPALLLLAASLGHWSWWLLLPISAKAGVKLAVSLVAIAVWVLRLPPERPAIYAPEVDKALRELGRRDHSSNIETIPGAQPMLVN